MATHGSGTFELLCQKQISFEVLKSLGHTFKLPNYIRLKHFRAKPTLFKREISNAASSKFSLASCKPFVLKLLSKDNTIHIRAKKTMHTLTKSSWTFVNFSLENNF